MALGGWIKLHRALADHPVASDPSSLSVWIHLLMLANHKETKRQINGQIVTLKAGQLITSRKSISEKTGVQESKVERVLKMLKSEQQIEQVGTAKFRVISIVNWCSYQGDEQVEEQQMNSSRTADEQQMNTPGEVLRTKECKEESISDQQAGSHGQINGSGLSYTAFQDAYNRICVPTLSACRAMSKKRQTLIKSLVNIEIDGVRPFRKHGIPFVEAFFTDCLKNPHWTGNNDRGWKANFDFLIRMDNAIRVLEENL